MPLAAGCITQPLELSTTHLLLMSLADQIRLFIVRSQLIGLRAEAGDEEEQQRLTGSMCKTREGPNRHARATKITTLAPSQTLPISLCTKTQFVSDFC